MEPPDFTSPREAARPFTPKLSALSERPLYDKVWENSDLSKRDRSLITSRHWFAWDGWMSSLRILIAQSGTVLRRLSRQPPSLALPSTLASRLQFPLRR